MKKILLVLLVVVGLQTQAQVNMCDSIIVTGSQYQLTMEINSNNTFVEEWGTDGGPLYSVGYDSLTNYHSVYNYNPSTGLPFDTLYTYIQYSIYDSLGNIMSDVCFVTWIWGGTSWARMGMTTGIQELTLDIVNDNKIYDLLGRELKEVPVGVMYIVNQKKYIKIK